MFHWRGSRILARTPNHAFKRSAELALAPTVAPHSAASWRGVRFEGRLGRAIRIKR